MAGPAIYAIESLNIVRSNSHDRSGRAPLVLQAAIERGLAISVSDIPGMIALRQEAVGVSLRG
jgi:hypothetical protein